MAATDCSSRALRDLRNIPDAVVLGLTADPTTQEAVLASSAMLSYEVFTHLVETIDTDSHGLHKLFQRHLTHAQRVFALKSKKTHRAWRTLCEHNILTLDELKLIPCNQVHLVLDRLVLDYYEGNEVVMSYLLPYLGREISARYVMRSSPERYSDDIVLSHMKAAYTEADKKSTDGMASKSIWAIDDLLRHRPHLALELLSLKDPRVTFVLAGSIHARRPEVLSVLLGADLKTRGVLYETHHQVREVLYHNPTVSYAVRSSVYRSYAKKSFIGTLPVDFNQVTEPGHVHVLVNRALGSGSEFETQEHRPWDIVDLATHPLLTRIDASRLLEKWRTPAKGGEYYDWVRVGLECAERTHLTLCDRAQVRPEGIYALPDLTLKVHAYRYLETPGEVYLPLDLDASIQANFHRYLVSPRDATSLVALLGAQPSLWHRFLQALDRAPEETPLRSVATTTLRLAR